MSMSKPASQTLAIYLIWLCYDINDQDIEANNDQDKTLHGRLPVRVWRGVLAELADPNCILTAQQVKSAFAYARDRRTLAVEMEYLGKTNSIQIWRVLEAMGCLAY